MPAFATAPDGGSVAGDHRSVVDVATRPDRDIADNGCRWAIRAMGSTFGAMPLRVTRTQT
jgi:hypothetical protein